MNELRQLVKKWMDGLLDYRKFRGEFVARFLSTLNADPAVELAANSIESECSDFEENLFELPELKRRVALSVQGAAVMAVGSVSFQFVTPLPCPPTTGTNSSPADIGLSCTANSSSLEIHA